MRYGMLKFNISQKTKMTFIISVIIGLVTHGFIMANKYPNWDDLGQLWDDMNRGTSGRWFMRFPAGISSMLSMPWIGGLLTILYISLAVCFVVDLLKLKKISSCALVAGIMLAFPSIGGNMFYTNSADAYGFGLLLMCIGVWISCRYKFGWIGGVVCTILSLAVYQTYFSIGCVLFMLVLAGQVLDGESKFTEILKNACKSFMTLLLGMIGYLVATKLYMGRKEMVSYNGMDTLGQINLKELPSNIAAAYNEFIDFFIKDVYEFHGLWKYVFVVVLVLTVYHIVEMICLKKIKVANIIFLALLISVLPVACGITYLMGADTVHLLMKYGFVGIFLVYIFINDIRVRNVEEAGESKRAWISSVVCLATALFVGALASNYIVKTNMAYFAAHVSYEQTYSYSMQLLTAVKLEVGKEESEIQKVLLVGRPEIDLADADTGWLYQKMFVNYTGLPYNLIQDGGYTKFLKRYCGFTHPVGYTSINNLEGEQAQTVLDMPVYPAEGSIVCMDDGVVFVKMKNE